MSDIRIATRAEWLAARKALLEKEKAHTRLKDEISAERRALPWVPLETDYTFETESGPMPFEALFGAARQLVVYHFMFGANWETGCKSCSFWADSFNGIAPHLENRDIGFVVVSRAPLAKLLPFKRRMGWDFPWVSSANSTFNADFGVGFAPDRAPNSPVTYNYNDAAVFPVDEAHGTSVFARDDGGQIYHTYSTYGRGLDVTNAAYAYMDLTPKGRNEPDGGNPMAWLRHHDDY